MSAGKHVDAAISKLESEASDYARRMREAPQLLLEVPAEWDFRPVREFHQAVDVVGYEYRREKDDYRDRVSAFLASTIAGRSIRSILLEAKRANVPPLEDEILQSPFRRHAEELGFVSHHPSFPLPWLRLPAEQRGEIARNFEALEIDIAPLSAPEDLETAEGLNQIAALLHQIGTVLYQKVCRTSVYELRVGWGMGSIESKCRKFEKWLREEAKNHPGPPRGKRTASHPWLQLKWLSARRLARSGLNWAKARDFLESYRDQNPMTDAPPVLPIFHSAGAWHDAIGKAERELDIRFRRIERLDKAVGSIFKRLSEAA
jgi:hypothetical protein